MVFFTITPQRLFLLHATIISFLQAQKQTMRRINTGEIVDIIQCFLSAGDKHIRLTTNRR